MTQNLFRLLVFVIIAIAITSCGDGIAMDSMTTNPDVSSEQFPEQTPEPTSTSIPTHQEYEIVTLLPRDAIPAIDQPTFLNADEADREYTADELVIGVEFNGDARAYSIPFLSSHEIVNDTVGGVKLAVTW